MKLKVFLNSYGVRQEVGLLAEDKGNIFFEYAPAFLQSGIRLSPFQLPLKPGVFVDKKRTFDGLFGLFTTAFLTGGAAFCLTGNCVDRDTLFRRLPRCTDSL